MDIGLRALGREMGPHRVPKGYLGLKRVEKVLQL